MLETEVEVNVPWGKISCKVFGKISGKTNEIILFLHDLHDNASSFDELIQNLSETRLYIAIDLPGHGKSSWIHPHATYHFVDFVLTVKYVIYRVLHRFNHDQSIKQIALVAHEKSAHIAAVFAQIYPKLISKLILLDDMYNYGIPAEDFSKTFRKINENYFSVENFRATKSPEEYSLENIIKVYKNKYNTGKIKFYEMLGDISEVESDTAKTVLAMAKRNSKMLENGKYWLRNDLQLKNILMHTTGCDYMIDFLEKYPITCPTLILCTQAKSKEHKLFLSTLKRKNKNVKVVKVSFPNYHIMKPATTAQFVDNFLSTNKVKSVNKL